MRVLLGFQLDGFGKHQIWAPHLSCFVSSSLHISLLDCCPVGPCCICRSYQAITHHF